MKKLYTEHEAMQHLEKQRKASEDHARHENTKEEARNPKFKATMDKVRAAMNEQDDRIKKAGGKEHKIAGYNAPSVKEHEQKHWGDGK